VDFGIRLFILSIILLSTCIFIARGTFLNICVGGFDAMLEKERTSAVDDNKSFMTVVIS
jgi:hypothetical protein